MIRPKLIFLALQAIPVDTGGFDSYALILECGVEEGRVEIEVRYDHAVLSESEMARLLNHFELVIQQLTNDVSNKTLGEIEMFSAQDRQQVCEWNKPPAVIERCLHEVFMEQALQRPDAPAICAWDANLSYQELDNLSSRLAHYLTSIGIRREMVIPFCFDKSAWTVVAMLAALKAGAALTPLNPQHPNARLKHIISETKASFVMASPHYATLFDEITVDVIKVDQLSLNTLPSLDQALAVQTQPTQLAFIAFTSGSTGQPKGILDEHQALCTSLYAHAGIMGFNIESRVLQFAAYTFDVCLTEIFGTFIYGGCVCIPKEADRVDNLAGLINRMQVNKALLTPTVASLIQPAEVPGLQTLTLGGEVLTQELVNRWTPHLQLINIYGVTECAIWASAYSFKSATVARISPDNAPATIGQGLGSTLWIVDPLNHDRLTPIGVCW